MLVQQHAPKIDTPRLSPKRGGSQCSCIRTPRPPHDRPLTQSKQPSRSSTPAVARTSEQSELPHTIARSSRLICIDWILSSSWKIWNTARTYFKFQPDLEALRTLSIEIRRYSWSSSQERKQCPIPTSQLGHRGVELKNCPSCRQSSQSNSKAAHRRSGISGGPVYFRWRSWKSAPAKRAADSTGRTSRPSKSSPLHRRSGRTEKVLDKLAADWELPHKVAMSSRRAAARSDMVKGSTSSLLEICRMLWTSGVLAAFCAAAFASFTTASQSFIQTPLSTGNPQQQELHAFQPLQSHGYMSKLDESQYFVHRAMLRGGAPPTCSPSHRAMPTPEPCRWGRTKGKDQRGALGPTEMAPIHSKAPGHCIAGFRMRLPQFYDHLAWCWLQEPYGWTDSIWVPHTSIVSMISTSISRSKWNSTEQPTTQWATAPADLPTRPWPRGTPSLPAPS